MLVANPALASPFLDAGEIEVPPDRDGTRPGRIVLAGGCAKHGEPVRLLRNSAGRVSELWLGSGKLLPEAKVAKELTRRYEAADNGPKEE